MMVMSFYSFMISPRFFLAFQRVLTFHYYLQGVPSATNAYICNYTIMICNGNNFFRERITTMRR